MNDLTPMKIQVACYSGYRGEETPRSMVISGKKIEVVDLIDKMVGTGPQVLQIYRL